MRKKYNNKNQKNQQHQSHNEGLIYIECPMGMSHTWQSQATVMGPSLRTKREG